jgi:hypothetical protein
MISFAILLCVFSLNTVYGMNCHTDDEKFYISSEQLICSDSGIFVLLENVEGDLFKILVPQISWDTDGLFVLTEFIPLPNADWCPRGHKACSRCGRCDVPGCPAYGCMCRRR